MKCPPALVKIASLNILIGSILAITGAQAVEHGTAAPKADSSQDAKDAKGAIKAFKFDPSLKVELFASEPTLANPVAFTVDEKGRWYIAETYRQENGVEDNRGHANWLDTDIAARTIEERLAMMHKFYPEAEKFAQKFTKFEDRITRVEDTDGDGIAEKQTIYADGFRDALDGTGAGILARGNDIWWTCIPNLWRFRDADGDGKAEVKEKLLTGFGVKFAFRGHDMHGLRFGPDGKLYFSIGDRGINVKSKEGTQVAEVEGGSIMRCNEDGTGFEIFATGVRNPQELAFDEFGNLFTGDNNSDSGDKARFVQLVEGGDCGWRMAYQYLPDRGPWNRELLWDAKEGRKAKYLNPPIANIGNGPSGLTYNPGTGLGAKYQRSFFLSDFRGSANSSVVHQIQLEADGAAFKVKRVGNFLQGILTTDCEFGNDGGLYVLDWVQSWGGVGKGRIYKFTDSTADRALQADTQKNISAGSSPRPEAELVPLLSHADMRVRMSAQFSLATKGNAAAFAKVAADPESFQLARIHAIWGLGQLAEKDSAKAQPLLALLGDADAEVRAQSAKVLGESKLIAAAERLVPLLKDSSPRARFFAALSLGKLAHKPAVGALFELLAENNDQDPNVRHAAVMGLVKCASSKELEGKSGDASGAVRVGAVLALRRQQSPAIAQFLKDADESIVLEAARAIHDMPIVEAFPALAALTANAKLTNPRTLERAINAHYRLGKAENARELAAFAANHAAPEASRKEALQALASWAAPSPKDRLLNQWRPLPDRPGTDAVAAITAALPSLLKDGPAGVQEAAAKLASSLSIGSAGESLAQLVSNAKAGTPTRIAALQALKNLKAGQLKDAVKVAMKDTDAKLRSEGLQILATDDPAAAVQLIGGMIANGSVGEKQSAVLAIAQLEKQPEMKTLLLSLMDGLIAGQAVPEIQLDIYEAAKKSAAPELKDKVNAYKAALKSGGPLAPYKISLAGGNVERGRKIFREKAEVQCLRCHKCEVGDSLVGPELTKVGASKDRLYLLESIVFPNKSIASGFGIVSLTLKDGATTAGRLTAEDGDNLKIETLDAQGKPQTVTVPVANIKERVNAPSAMPENTRDNLTATELRDVIEYLALLK